MTIETESTEDQPREPQEVAIAPPPPTGAAAIPPPVVSTASQATSDTATVARLRAEFAEVAAIAAQAARLGVSVDAADALTKGVAPDALRRTVLDTLAARAEATSVIAAAPSTVSAPGSGTGAESPIVRRAKERAAASRA